MANLADLVARYEKVSAQIGKKQTPKLRAERDDLAQQIQAAVQAHREQQDADWRADNSHLSTAEQIEAAKPGSPSPRSVQAGVN